MCNSLEAGVVENGRRVAAEKGAPRRAAISPMPPNIHLHDLPDPWAHQWRHRRATGQVVSVRDADEFVLN